MADNFLEKRQEELRGGRTVIRRVNPSIDELLARTAAEEAGEGAAGRKSASYTVKAAQIDAMLRSAHKTGAAFEADYTEGSPALIRLSIVGGAVREPSEGILLLGELLLALKLKAAELHLCASLISFSPDTLTVQVCKSK